MRYAVLSGGKRVRPILALAACEAVPAARRSWRCRSAAPSSSCMPTRWCTTISRRWTTTSSGAAGRRCTSSTVRRSRSWPATRSSPRRSASPPEGARQAGVDPARALGVIATVAAAAGAARHGRRPGRRSRSRGAVADRAIVESIHRRKTAALIAAAVDAGAVAGERRRDRRAALAEYGRALGLAFQIADDILDATAPTAVTGKRVGGDAEHGKATFPGVLGLDGARAAARDLLARCRAAADVLGAPGEPLRAIASFVVERAC